MTSKINQKKHQRWYKIDVTLASMKLVYITFNNFPAFLMETVSTPPYGDNKAIEILVVLMYDVANPGFVPELSRHGYSLLSDTS